MAQGNEKNMDPEQRQDITIPDDMSFDDLRSMLQEIIRSREEASGRKVLAREILAIMDQTPEA